jgi:hypothetical protein
MGAFAVLRKVLLQMTHWISLADSFYGAFYVNKKCFANKAESQDTG